MATEPAKARVIWVRSNGDKTYENPAHNLKGNAAKGIRVVLHPVKMRDIEQLKAELTARVRLVTGAVRKIYSVKDGNEITSLDQFETDHIYICCGGEKLRVESLDKGASPKRSPTRSPAQRPSPVRLPDPGKTIIVYRNGDKYHAGSKFVVTDKKYKEFDQLLADCSVKVGVSTGAVRKLVTLDGNVVDSISAIENGTKYVCCGGERYDPENSAKVDSKGVKIPSTPSPSPKPKAKPKIEMFGTQGEKGKHIFAFVNGDKHHKGHEFVLRPKKVNTMEQFKFMLSKDLTVPTGPVQKVYHFCAGEERLFVEIKSIEELEDGANYLVCGPEKVNKEAMPNILKELNDKKKKAKAHGESNGGDLLDDTTTTTTSTSFTREPTPEPTPTPTPVSEPEPAIEPEAVSEPEPVAAVPDVADANPPAESTDAADDDDSF